MCKRKRYKLNTSCTLHNLQSKKINLLSNTTKGKRQCGLVRSSWSMTMLPFGSPLSLHKEDLEAPPIWMAETLPHCEKEIESETTAHPSSVSSDLTLTNPFASRAWSCDMSSSTSRLVAFSWVYCRQADWHQPDWSFAHVNLSTGIPDWALTMCQLWPAGASGRFSWVR